MITYEEYCKIRDSKGLRDGDVAKKAGIQASTFSEWKKGKCTPKMDKMAKIADALEMDYFAFVGPVGKFSALNPNRQIPMLKGMEKTPEQRFDENLLRLYHTNINGWRIFKGLKVLLRTVCRAIKKSRPALSVSGS